MPVKCGERVTRRSRDGSKEITPTLSYTCELEAGHEGPCASPSDLTSVNNRQAWEAQHARDEALRRHQESGLGQTQSLPMPSAAIIESDITDPQRKVGRVHPSQEVDCPFCSAKPMMKDFVTHVKTHESEPMPGTEEAAEIRNQVRSKLPMPPPSKPKMAPRRSEAPESYQGIEVDTRPVLSEEPVPYFSEGLDEPDPEAGLWISSYKEGDPASEPVDKVGMTSRMAMAVLGAWIEEIEESGQVPDLVLIAWESIKISLRG